jgi:hypothetical protein
LRREGIFYSSHIIYLAPLLSRGKKFYLSFGGLGMMTINCSPSASLINSILGCSFIALLIPVPNPPSLPSFPSFHFYQLYLFFYFFANPEKNFKKIKKAQDNLKEDVQVM